MAKLFQDKYFFLLNLKQISDETLASYGPCGVMNLLLKRAEDCNFIEWVKENAHLMPAMALDDVYTLSIHYALEVGIGKVQELVATFTELFPQHKENTMTAARQLEKKGKIEGIRTRSIQIAQGMLAKNYPIEDIIQLTQLSKEEINRLKK